MNRRSRPKRKRIPSKKHAKSAQPTKQSTVMSKPKTTRRKRRRKQHVQSGPSTPKVTSKTKRKKKRKPATKALTPVPPSVSMPRSNIMHMCDCGLLHATLDVVTSPHKAHASSCLLHNQAEPPCTLSTFHPMTNTRLTRRKKNKQHCPFRVVCCSVGVSMAWQKRLLADHTLPVGAVGCELSPQIRIYLVCRLNSRAGGIAVWVLRH